MCSEDGRTCTLDPRHPLLGAQPGDVLRVESICVWWVDWSGARCLACVVRGCLPALTGRHAGWPHLR